MEKNTSENKGTLSSIFDFVSIVATAVVAVAFAFIFLFRTVGVVGSSMYPTLENGNRIILSAFTYSPENGDIVVTCQPNDSYAIEDVLVKRVIATAGQTVDIDFEKGIVYVDGEMLDEPYINEPTHDREDFNRPVTVPEGYVFVMGDNRNHSTDSRDNRVGLIREEYILGEALFRMLPFGQFKIG
ncbi:MAG: signal peptidase I [Clostridia bacterium]|nr:signal peptidase I [Clostridia bacterium]